MSALLGEEGRKQMKAFADEMTNKSFKGVTIKEVWAERPQKADGSRKFPLKNEQPEERSLKWPDRSKLTWKAVRAVLFF